MLTIPERPRWGRVRSQSVKRLGFRGTFRDGDPQNVAELGPWSRWEKGLELESLSSSDRFLEERGGRSDRSGEAE